MQVRVGKDADGNVLTREESVLKRCREYFEELVVGNEKERRVAGGRVERKVEQISKEDVRKTIVAMSMMKNGKALVRMMYRLRLGNV